MDVKVEERAFPWSHPEVQELHKQFDQEFAKVTSPKEGEALFQRFFAPKGLVEAKIQEWQGKDVDLQDVLRIVFELYSFKCFVFTCFFFNDYPEEIVKEWWEKTGMRSWASEKGFTQDSVKDVKQMFDKESLQCKTMLDLEGVRGKFLSPLGVLAQEFRKLRTLDKKQQVATGAELFSLKSYIDYTLFAMEFSTKAAVWTVPEVRELEYRFETDLKEGRSEEDLKSLKDRYLGKDGLIEEMLVKVQSKKGEQATKQVEELNRLKESLEDFFTSHANQEKKPVQ